MSLTMSSTAAATTMTTQAESSQMAYPGWCLLMPMKRAKSCRAMNGKQTAKRAKGTAKSWGRKAEATRIGTATAVAQPKAHRYPACSNRSMTASEGS
jgi:hypothetical protein